MLGLIAISYYSRGRLVREAMLLDYSNVLVLNLLRW
jgi:hypothetical protein